MSESAATTGAEKLFWSEVSNPDSTRRSVALCYCLLMADNLNSGPDFWTAVNLAVIRRFKMKTEKDLISFQSKARDIYRDASNQACPTFSARSTDGNS